MMTQGRAFSPGHVTGLFYMQDADANPLYSGSLGAGFSLAKGAYTDVSLREGEQDHIIRINRQIHKDAPVTRKAAELFFSETGISPRPLVVTHTIETPLGAGFGSSGAGALSLLYAVNRLFGDPLTQQRAAQIAHAAEVLCKTGLGTVMGETLGGFKVSIRTGAPGIGEVICIPYPKDCHAAFFVFGPYSTSDALSDPVIRERIIKNGKKYHEAIQRKPVFENFLSLSRDFAESIGIIPASIRVLLDRLDTYNLKSSMLMFGEGTFTLFDGHEISEIRRIFENIRRDTRFPRKPAVFFSPIAGKGADIIDED